MTNAERFFREIVDTHIAIERWFTGAAAPAELAHLLGRFSPEFRMISMQGAVLTKEDVGELFGRLHGKRAGLRIAVDEMQVRQEWHGGGCLTYRETHEDAGGVPITRRSTVVLTATADGSLRWQHLQETPIAV